MKTKRIKGQIEIDLEREEVVVPDYPIREQTEDEYQRLTESIKNFGFVSPVVVVVRDGKFVIVDGRHRLRIARELGLKKIPAVVLDVEEGEKEEILAAILEVCRKFLSQEEVETLLERLVLKGPVTSSSDKKKLEELEEVVSGKTEKSYEEIVEISKKYFSEEDVESLRERIREEVENELRESFELEKEELEREIEARVRLRLEQELRAKLRDEYREEIKNLKREKEELQAKTEFLKNELSKKQKEVSALYGKMEYHEKAIRQALADYARAFGYDTLMDYLSTLSSTLDGIWKILHLWSYRNEGFLTSEQREAILDKVKEIKGKFHELEGELIATTAACLVSLEELMEKFTKKTEEERREFEEEENPEDYGLTPDLWKIWGGGKKKGSASVKN